MPETGPQEIKKIRRFGPELHATWEFFPQLAKMINEHRERMNEIARKLHLPELPPEKVPDLPHITELLWRMLEILSVVQESSQATFITVEQEPSLLNSRYLFAGDNVTLTDEGKLGKLIVEAAGGSGATPLCGSLDTTIEGGLVGTHLNSASPGATATIGTPYSGSSTTAKWMPQSRYCLSGPYVAISAAQPDGQFGMIFWNTKDQASTILVTNAVATMMPPGGAAGSYINADIMFYTQAYQQYAYTGSGTVTSAPVEGVSSKVIGSRVQPLGNYLSLSTRVAGSTNYTGAGQGNTAAVTNEDLVIIPVPFACTLKNAAIITGGTQPGTGSLVATFRDDKVDTALVLTVPAGGTAGVRKDSSTTVAIAAHSGLSIKEVNNAAGASTSIDSYHFELLPTAGTVKALLIFPMYLRVPVAGASRYAPGYFNNGLETTEALAWTPIPYATASMRYLDCWVETAPANDLVITVIKNGVATAVTGTLTSAFAAPGVFQIDAGSQVALVAGDRLSIEFAAGAGGQATISGCGLEIDD